MNTNKTFEYSLIGLIAEKQIKYVFSIKWKIVYKNLYTLPFVHRYYFSTMSKALILIYIRTYKFRKVHGNKKNIIFFNYYIFFMLIIMLMCKGYYFII